MRSTSSPVSTFDKILRAYGTGGFTYADVMAQLQRLLAIGASPEAMLETLRRRERIEPFPEYAHVEVVRLLNAAIARDAAEAAANTELHGDPAQEPSTDAGALTESALRLRGEEGARELKRDRTELTSLRDTLSARDAQLAARDAELAALRQEHAKAVSLLETRAETGAQLEANAQAAEARSSSLAAELATTRNALQSELVKSRDLNQVVAETRAELKQSETLALDLSAQVRRLRTQLDAGKVRLDGMRGAPLFVPAAPETTDNMRMREPVAADRGKRWNLRSGARPLIAGFAIVLLAIAAWFFGKPSQAPKQAAVSAPTAIPAPGTMIPDCPTCTSNVELPTEGLKQGSPAAQNPSPSPPTTASAVSPSSAKTSGAAPKRATAPCSAHADIEACYDAIRRNPNDPVLLVGLGDALLRAKRPQDAIRNYRRAALLAPGMVGLAAKISAAEQPLAPKHPAVRRE